MTKESLEARMARGDKMLKLFEQGVNYAMLKERFRLSGKNTVHNYLTQARIRRDKAREQGQ